MDFYNSLVSARAFCILVFVLDIGDVGTLHLVGMCIFGTLIYYIMDEFYYKYILGVLSEQEKNYSISAFGFSTVVLLV